MKTKKLMIALAGICLLFLVAGPVMAAGEPSAKFAAFWTETPGLASVVNITDASVDTVAAQRRNGYTLATIKVPQAKELLVGVSAEIGLVTFTGVKGKNGGTASSLAGGIAFVTVAAVPRGGGNSIMAAPGQIILSKRVQELTATLGGVIQSCQVTCVPVYDPVTGAVTGIDCEDIDIAADCVVTDEQIALLLNTTAAHHFNFVLPNVPVGVYDIKAFFTTGARAKVDICDAGDTWCTYDAGGTVTASANAKAVINKTMLTVQQVRATKGGAGSGEIIEITE